MNVEAEMFKRNDLVRAKKWEEAWRVEVEIAYYQKDRAEKAEAERNEADKELSRHCARKDAIDRKRNREVLAILGDDDHGDPEQVYIPPVTLARRIVTTEAERDRLRDAQPDPDKLESIAEHIEHMEDYGAHTQKMVDDLRRWAEEARAFK